MSSSIPVKAIWSNQDLVCPKALQDPVWNTIPNAPVGGNVFLDGDHGYQVGRQDSAFMAELNALLAGLDNEPVISGNCDVNWGWF